MRLYIAKVLLKIATIAGSKYKKYEIGSFICDIGMWVLGK